MKKFNQGSNLIRFCFGFLAWGILVLPLPIFIFWLQSFLPFYLLIIINVYIVYWAVALNSLNQHGMQIYKPLIEGDLNKAQRLLRLYC
ncbi:cobalamin biosynthesis protein [Psychromonas sp. KJ10-10]|uniref:cobalamin biosynthesis protein n=1 Tax=Psychromonas sp. KJ10-10 TaxID=3391823 RepID=UPI0039B5B519